MTPHKALINISKAHDKEFYQWAVDALLEDLVCLWDSEIHLNKVRRAGSEIALSIAVAEVETALSRLNRNARRVMATPPEEPPEHKNGPFSRVEAAVTGK